MQHLQTGSLTDHRDQPALVFLRMHAVMKITGLGRSTIYRLIASKQFPRRFSRFWIGTCRRRWRKAIRGSEATQHGRRPPKPKMDPKTGGVIGPPGKSPIRPGNLVPLPDFDTIPDAQDRYEACRISLIVAEHLIMHRDEIADGDALIGTIVKITESSRRLFRAARRV